MVSLGPHDLGQVAPLLGAGPHLKLALSRSSLLLPPRLFLQQLALVSLKSTPEIVTPEEQNNKGSFLSNLCKF